MKKLLLFTATIIIVFLGSTSAIKAATFNSSPTIQNFKQGCPVSFNIDIDTQGVASNAADIEIKYNPSEVTILDSDRSASGIQIETGNAYEAYVANSVDTNNGVIRIAATSFINNLNGKKRFATIHLQSNTGVSSTKFTINYVGPNDTLDSNIAKASDSTDLLTGVTNATFTFSPGTCIGDTVPPVVTFTNPTNGASNIALDNNIVLQITDTGDGVDINSLIIVIGNTQYKPGDGRLTFTGTPSNYTVTINPVDDFPSNSIVIVSLSVKDLAGNSAAGTISFNNPGGSTCNALPQNTGAYKCQVKDVVPVAKTFSPIFDNFLESLPAPLREVFGELTLPEITNGVISLTLLANLLSFLLGLRSPQLIYLWLSSLFGKKSKPWGVVYDVESNEPIHSAIIKAFIEGTSSIVEQKATNKEGKYGLLLSTGKYRIEASHRDYSTIAKNIEITTKNQIVPVDFGLSVNDIRNMTKENIFSKINRITQRYNKILLMMGIFVSLIALIFEINLINIVILLLYLVFLFTILINESKKAEKWGSVIDSLNHLKIQHAVVRFYNSESWEIVDTQVTNIQGDFGIFVGPGTYGIVVSKPGYSYPSKLQTNLKKAIAKAGVLTITLADSYQASPSILIDPIIANSKK